VKRLQDNYEGNPGGRPLKPVRPKTREILNALKEANNIKTFTTEYVDAFVDVTFKDYLDSLLLAKGVKKAAVIKASGLTDSYAFQIFQGFRSPSRDKLLALAVGLGTTYDECQKLLKLAGVNELYVKNRRDAIIIYSLEKGLSVPELNDVLFDLEEFTL